MLEYDPGKCMLNLFINNASISKGTCDYNWFVKLLIEIKSLLTAEVILSCDTIVRTVYTHSCQCDY